MVSANAIEHTILPKVSDFDVIITPHSQGVLSLKDLWRYRELVRLLCWRDLKVRYKQTMLGLGWAVAQPLISMAVFSIFFGRLIQVESDGLPYPVFCYAGLLVWTHFASTINRGTNSLINNAHLITKIYFPRAVVPLASILPGFVDFAAALATAIPLLVYYKITPPLSSVIVVPAILLISFLLSLGFVLWLSAINARYRDLGFLIPFIVQLWMFATPVVYSSRLIPEKYSTWAYLNPMYGIVVGFRSALLGQPFPLIAVGITLVIAVILLVSGIFYFRSVEKGLADVI